MRKLLTCLFCCLSLAVLSQKKISIKWDITRLLNPFNSTIQLGAEYFVNEKVSLSTDIGLLSGLYNVTFYNKGIFIMHNQVRKYRDHSAFWGADLFYMHTRDYADFLCLYNKNKKFNADYDTVTLVKNAIGLALVSGKQAQMGHVVLELYGGIGIRLVNNHPDYKKETIHTGSCPTTHYNWSNDRYSGTFPGGHFLAGIKIGYLLNGKRKRQ